ncbi:MAG: VPLPA-CTERM sorting domain-containing protein [Paracoccaceae bacterium]
MKALSFKALAVATALLTAGGATATPVTPLTADTGWTSFGFGAVGTLAKRTYSFTVTTAALFKIVDGFTSGDRFQILVNNVSHGLSSLTTAGFKAGTKWDVAYASPNFSHRTLYFGPGSYTISIVVAQRAGTDTALHNGAVRLDTSEVPVPAGGLLLISALGAAAAARRRKA